MAYVDIIQLLKNEDGEKFYPVTHKNAVIGLDEFNYFDVVSDGNGGLCVRLKPQYTGFYADGWVAAGGIGSGSGGGAIAPATTTTLGGILAGNVAQNTPTINPVSGDVSGRYYYVQVDTNGLAFVNVPWTGGGGTLSPATDTTLGGVKVGSVIQTPTINAISSTGGRYYYLQTDSNGLAFVNVPWTGGSGGGGSVDSITVNGTNYSPSSGVVTLPDYPTSLPASDVYQWAKASTKPFYNFSEIGSTPTTLSGYGITDAKFSSAGSGVTDKIKITLGSTSYDVLTQHQSLASITGRLDAIEAWFEVVNVAASGATPEYALHAKNGYAIYSDSWVSAGGIGSGSGGGSLSPATASTLGGVKVGSVIQTPTINAISSTGGRYYYLQTDSNGLAFVNVPWTGGSGGGGSVDSITVNGTNYSPSSGVVTLPDYPTSLPASDVYQWAKASTKPSYNFSEIGSTPTTLSGYGITDAKIASGVITLGNNTITPLTSHQTVTLASGTNNGTLKLTTAAGTTDNISVKGLGSLAFLSSLSESDIPSLSASKITSGTFDIARIPDLAASKITSGTFDAARIPDLDASKITSGTFAVARIPDLSGKYVTLDTAQNNISGKKTFTGGLAVDGGSYLDIGNVRLVYDSNANALHVTKKDGTTGTIGIYADGFVAAGGVAGGTPSYVDLESNQTIDGDKSFDGTATFNGMLNVDCPSIFSTEAQFSDDISLSGTLNGLSVIKDSNNYVSLRASRIDIQDNGNNLFLCRGGGKVFLCNHPGGTVSHKLYLDSSSTAIAQSWNTHSDFRLKEDIVELQKDDSIEKLMALKPSIWKWKSGTAKGQIASGFIAQEVEPVLPFMVTGEDYKGLAYQMLHAYEVSAIQSHEERIKVLEKKVKTMEG